MTSIARVESTRDLLTGANTAAAVADEHAEQGDRKKWVFLDLVDEAVTPNHDS